MKTIAALLLAALPYAIAANQPTLTFALSGIPFRAVAVDSQGNTFVAGSTIYADIPVTAGAFQTTFTPRNAQPSWTLASQWGW